MHTKPKFEECEAISEVDLCLTLDWLALLKR
jgi:hypothetical protein